MSDQEEEELKKRCGNVLRSLRVQKPDSKLTQDDVAKAIGLHCSAYNMLEKGKRKIYLSEILDLAKYYGIRLADFAAEIERSPAELDKLQQLQIMLDQALKENAFLKEQLNSKKS